MKRGVYLRAMGNTIYVMPPYVITTGELRKIYGVITDFLDMYHTGRTPA
jgi:adenosylmethionine-8-amino-7-oxononanoate aminotransferase